MTLKTCAKIFALCASILFASNIIYNYFNRRRKLSAPKEIHDVLMFSHGENDLKRSKYSRCMISPSMERLLYYLNSPRYSLDVCMYVLTNADLANAVLKLHYRGVKVRLIIDADMAFSTGSSVRKLEKQGIPLRWMKSTNLMHHKFCLLDASTENVNVTSVVIMGSLNWTNQALTGNWEDVAVTSQSVLVMKYKEEFERLWVLFKPVVDF